MARKVIKVQQIIHNSARSKGLLLGNLKKVQIAILQLIALNGSELRWNNQVGTDEELRKLVNKEARLSGTVHDTYISGAPPARSRYEVS